MSADLGSELDVEDMLDDLALLDEPRHALCAVCYPVVPPPYTRVVGLCGALSLRKPPIPGLDPQLIPPDACEACLPLLHMPCRRCGPGGPPA